MKTHYCILIISAATATSSLDAQEAPSPNRADQPTANATGDYASDLAVVSDAQQQALDLAKQQLAQAGDTSDHGALDLAIQEMERAQTMLKDAKNSPDKLPAAIAAEQAAYQALLKTMPQEYDIQRSRSSQNGNGNSSGQPDQRQIEQLEMTDEQNRYETERQAAEPQSAQQREQTQTVDRLKELAQRQQDLNDRMRELQTALQAARTDRDRKEIQQQLKRLDDEQRQQLANVDELRQQLAQSPNASSESDARQQLDQIRSNMQRASEQLQNQSASQALAAGTRAQQQLDQTRQDIQKKTSGQFSEQMRQLRNEARDMKAQENEIARGLDSLNNGGQPALDDSAQRQQIIQQMAKQQSTLTNLLAGMREVTQQAESTEPLLSKQLYDTLRRADQMHTDNLLDMGSQLTDHGFLPQASQAERAAHTNIDELANSVERAADGVLGSEADALRYAKKQLDDLTQQMEREIGDTNSATFAAGDNVGAPDQSKRPAPAEGNPTGARGTNAMAVTNGISSRNESQLAGDNSQHQQSDEDNSPGQQTDSHEPGGNGQPQGGQNGDEADRLRQIAEQLGRGKRGANDGGPITGNDFVNWSDQARDVESVLDQPDLRNQLATVRDRVAALRGSYRDHGQRPDLAEVRRQILIPLEQVRVWVQEELSRQENASSLVPLDRDPVPENYSDLVRKYYEKLGSAQ
ncbi:MAG: hypothetical protein ABSE48_02255 [Verrucomicrobiota bacterium]|jgi:hypothetical protein